MEQETKYKRISEKAQKNLERNELLRRIEWGLEPIPPLRQSTIAIFDAERIEPVTEEVNGKSAQKFKYVVSVPPAYDYDTGERELTVDAKTSAEIDAYLSQGLKMMDIEISRRQKGTRYKILPIYPDSKDQV